MSHVFSIVQRRHDVIHQFLNMHAQNISLLTHKRMVSSPYMLFVCQIRGQIEPATSHCSTFQALITLKASKDYRFIKVPDKGFVRSYDPETSSGTFQTMVYVRMLARNITLWLINVMMPCCCSRGFIPLKALLSVLMHSHPALVKIATVHWTKLQQ